MKVEEYSSSEVPDSDNNSIKESVEFSEPSFRTNLQNLLWKSLRKLTFPLLAGSCFRIPLPSSETRFSSELREREIISRLVCLRKRNRSAGRGIFVRYFPTVAAVRTEPLQLFGPTAQPHNGPTAQTVFRHPLAGGLDPERSGSGSGMLATHTRFKKNQAG